MVDSFKRFLIAMPENIDVFFPLAQLLMILTMVTLVAARFKFIVILLSSKQSNIMFRDRKLQLCCK